MYDQHIGFCRYCGRQIIWTRTRAGKAMPCEPGMHRYVKDQGPEVFITPDGETHRGRRYAAMPGISGRTEGADGPEWVEGYEPHWALCPGADRARKRGGKPATGGAR